jgi:hypothetical protein
MRSDLESVASLMLEIDKRHSKNQDRDPANVKLFFFSIEHSQPFSSGQLPFRAPAPVVSISHDQRPGLASKTPVKRLMSVLESNAEKVSVSPN